MPPAVAVNSCLHARRESPTLAGTQQAASAALRPSSVKSADRVFDLLELLAATGRAMSHGELSRRTAIPKGSLTALLRNLITRGYVEYLERTQDYRLGERAYELARRGAHHRDLVRLSQP